MREGGWAGRGEGAHGRLSHSLSVLSGHAPRTLSVTLNLTDHPYPTLHTSNPNPEPDTDPEPDRTCTQATLTLSLTLVLSLTRRQRWPPQ